MAALETASLTKHYGEHQALRGVSVRIEAGACCGLLGPNGAGKTTLIRILLGLLRPSTGSARVFGGDAWRDGPRLRRDIGYLPGDVRLYDWMRGRTLLSFVDRMRGGAHGSEAARLCERFDLRADRPIDDYSRGMKQKLGLMTALMHRPRLVILDEPTTALDPLVREVLFDELRTAVGEGRTVLFSSHTLSEVEALCDHVLIIRGGLIIEDSPIARLRERAFRRVQLCTADRGPLLAAPPEWALLPGPSEDGWIRGAWHGDARSLLTWLKSLELDDVTISPPDLEDLFAAYYRDTPSA